LTSLTFILNRSRFCGKTHQRTLIAARTLKPANPRLLKNQKHQKQSPNPEQRRQRRMRRTLRMRPAILLTPAMMTMNDYICWCFVPFLSTHIFIFPFMNGSCSAKLYPMWPSSCPPYCSSAMVILISIDKFSFLRPGCSPLVIFLCLIIASSTHCATSLSLYICS
jgi:hypothetical protein